MEQVFFNVPLAKLEPIFKKWVKDVFQENKQRLLQTHNSDDLANIIKNSVSEVLQETNRLQPQMTKNPEYLTRKATAEKLHISLTTLDTYTRLGILNAVKVGHRVLYNSADLDESLSEKINNIKHKMK